MKKFIVLTLIFIMSMGSQTVTSYAKTIETTKSYSKVPTIGEGAPDPIHGTGMVESTNDIQLLYDMQSTYGFKGGSCSLINTNKVGVVRAYAQTVADYVVDEIGYKLYYQIWDGYEWTDLSSVNNSSTNASEISYSYDKSVISGKYYRVRVAHYTIENGSKYSAESTSSYILVN